MSKGALKFEDGLPIDESTASGQNVPKSGGKLKQDKQKARYSDRLRHTEMPNEGGKASSKPNNSKLRIDKSGEKPDRAKETLANKSAQKRGLIKSTAASLRSYAWLYAHGKIYQAEHENIGIKAAHRTELAGEGVVKSGKRFIKNRVRESSARSVRVREKRAVNKKAGQQYKAALKENPEMKKSLLRQFQKRRIKKQYQKQAKETARKAAAASKNAAAATGRTGKAVVAFVRRNPKLVLITLAAVLLVVVIQSFFTNALQMGSGVGVSIAASTYLSDDSEMLAAEAAYADMENGLQYQLDNFETIYPGYDEYHYDIDSIGHDPYVLISILSAMYEGAWTLEQVQGTLAMLFDLQYTLTVTVTVEVRYRTETITDILVDEFGNIYTETYTELVEYNYYICDVRLENFNLSHLPVYILSEDGLSRYAIYMATLGNRPDLFPSNIYPNASIVQDFERYEIPPDALADPVFRAMITEAEKYLGFPYVWGGSNPSTSFDCSGFVSWVINHSGWNVGRLGAKGLYNICTPVSPSAAKPGDLVFFWRTYRAPDPNAPTHVGIYVGNGMMIHCGNPISYTSINTAYWQNHFYGFGRLP